MHNIDPKIWGPSMWKVLIYSVLSYPDEPNKEEQINMKNFLVCVGKILPCEKCRYNYANHTTKYSINDEVLNNKKKLIDWLTSVYNEVRTMNGQKKLTSDEIIYKYTEDQYYKKITNIIYIIMLIIIIFLLIFFIKYKPKNN